MVVPRTTAIELLIWRANARALLNEALCGGFTVIALTPFADRVRTFLVCSFNTRKQSLKQCERRDAIELQANQQPYIILT